VNRPEDEFDEELMRGLRRVDAPEGFAARVMERSAVVPTHDDKTVMNGPPRVAKVLAFPKPRAWMGSAMAAVLVLGCFVAERVHVERQKAELAQQQFETAVRVTDHALDQTREQLARAGLRLGN